jgi:small nuclear ribonucleoprotein (snRNP)-like protein
VFFNKIVVLLGACGSQNHHHEQELNTSSNTNTNITNTNTNTVPTNIMSNTTSSQQQLQMQSINLGKPSFKRRLEDYYSLISPDVISAIDWKLKFDQIYAKYGGSLQSELQLARKLEKKYGSAVKLLTVAAASQQSAQGGRGQRQGTPGEGVGPSASSQPQETISTYKYHPEEWFELRPEEQGSGITDFTSSRFDPLAALQLRPDHAKKDMKGFDVTAPLLDNVSKARRLLPAFDPLCVTVTSTVSSSLSAIRPSTSDVASPALAINTSLLAQIAQNVGGGGGGGTTTKTINNLNNRNKHKAVIGGPLSLLHRCFLERKRIKILVRYSSSGIRGQLTGCVVGYDKHFNMFLRDVDEVYTKPIPPIISIISTCTTSAASKHGHGTSGEEETETIINDNHHNLSQVEIEVQRRLMLRHQPNNTNIVKRRHVKQMFVRGDNVVSLWVKQKQTQNQNRQQVSRRR